MGTLTTMFGASLAKWRPSVSMPSTSSATTSADTGPGVILQEICKITPGPVSAEVVAEDVDGMLTEGRHFAKLAPNIVVKVPMSEEGRSEERCVGKKCGT